jgi:hypothetical protein
MSDTQSKTTGAYPRHWMWEPNGILVDAVRAYIDAGSGELSADHAAALRQHLSAWMLHTMDNVPAVKALWLRVSGLRSRADFAAWLADADKLGINPI